MESLLCAQPSRCWHLGGRERGLTLAKWPLLLGIAGNFIHFLPFIHPSLPSIHPSIHSLNTYLFLSAMCPARGFSGYLDRSQPSKGMLIMECPS